MRLLKFSVWVAIEDRIPHTAEHLGETLEQFAMSSAIEAEIVVAVANEKQIDYPDFSRADDREDRQDEWFHRAGAELVAYAQDHRDHRAARKLQTFVTPDE